MGQHDLNEGLAKHVVKPGDPGRNPHGFNNPALRRRNSDIKKLLAAAADEPSDMRGCEHLTKQQVGIRMLMELYQNGVQWAVKEVHNRLYGRVPYDVQATVTPKPDVSQLSPEELLARLDALREKALAEIAERDGDVIDAEPVPAEDRKG
jgi:hypothetical protein